MRRWRRAAARLSGMAVAPLLLGSCSYAFDVRAVAIGGRLAFVSADDDFDCVANISVSAGPRTAPVAVPATGDDRGLVVDGRAYWRRLCQARAGYVPDTEPRSHRCLPGPLPIRQREQFMWSVPMTGY